MKKGQDPSVIFDQIGSIEYQYNTPDKHIEESELIAVVLDAATVKYQPVLTSEQRLCGDHLTLEHLESAMNQHWRQVKSSKTHDEDGAEISLVAFGGTCFLCDKTGHKANTCPMKNKANHGNSNLVHHALTPYYMRLFQEFCEAFSAFSGSMEIHIYQPHVNHATGFLSVLLNINVVQIIGEDPDLESLFPTNNRFQKSLGISLSSCT